MGLEERFKYTKGIARSRYTKKERPYNDQQKNDNKINNGEHILLPRQATTLTQHKIFLKESIDVMIRGLYKILDLLCFSHAHCRKFWPSSPE